MNFRFLLSSASLYIGGALALFGQQQVVSTIKGETFEARITGVNSRDVKMEFSDYANRDIKSLPLKYVKSIRFSDSYTAYFDDGTLIRDNILDARMQKGMNYKAEGIFKLNEDEIRTMLGDTRYYQGWDAWQGNIRQGNAKIIIGTGVFMIGHFLHSREYDLGLSRGNSFTKIICYDMQFGTSVLPLFVQRFGLGMALYGVGETAVSNIVVANMAKKDWEIDFASSRQLQRMKRAGTWMSLAGTFASLAGLMVWAQNFETGTQYSLFGGKFYPGYYFKGDKLMYSYDLDNPPTEKKQSVDYLGPWLTIAGCLLLNAGLSVHRNASSRLRHSDSGIGIAYVW